MESIDALALAIKEFEGGVVIVSHDFRTCLSISRNRDLTQFPLRRVDFSSRRRTLGGQEQDD